MFGPFVTAGNILLGHRRWNATQQAASHSVCGACNNVFSPLRRKRTPKRETSASASKIKRLGQSSFHPFGRRIRWTLDARLAHENSTLGSSLYVAADRHLRPSFDLSLPRHLAVHVLAFHQHRLCPHQHTVYTVHGTVCIVSKDRNKGFLTLQVCEADQCKQLRLAWRWVILRLEYTQHGELWP
jgi:hypothetical protein